MKHTPWDLTPQNIYIGTSSWKYEGWKGIVYKEKYPSIKAFNANCLKEYSESYPCVGVDHTYYQWPSEKGFDTYTKDTPKSFKFGLKVTEEITVYKYPHLKRYGKLAGKPNPHFLNGPLFIEKFLNSLVRHKDRLGPIVFEFSKFYPGTLSSGRDFTTRFKHFMESLKPFQDRFNFAVEIRNRTWLQKEYFSTLLDLNCSPVFNSWTEMPGIGEQLKLASGFKFPLYASRLLLKPGRSYNEAVKMFQPYQFLQEPLLDLRKDTVSLIHRALDLKVPAYVFVNNRSEGCAPKTIDAILKLLK